MSFSDDSSISELAIHAELDREFASAQSSLELLEKLEPMLEKGSSECREYIDVLWRIPGSEKLIQQIEDMEFQTAIVTLRELIKRLEIT
jgi:hypothetical protein